MSAGTNRNELTLDIPDDYWLRQSVQFLTGFTPQRVEGDVDESDQARLTFATPLAPSWEPTNVAVAEVEGRLHVEWTGQASADAVARHVRRILGIDVDIAGLADIISADPVLARVVDWDRGVRPSLFWSPYEAAIWAVISQRIQMRQATNLKSKLATDVGESADSVPTTPTPKRLSTLETFGGLNDLKVARLRAVGRAALDGLLDPEELRSMSPTNAMASLQQIDGIGPFSAELVLVRGAGAPDVFPMNERRLHGTMRDLYGRPDASPGELAEIAAAWKPFRSWLSFQLRAHGERAR